MTYIDWSDLVRPYINSGVITRYYKDSFNL